VQLAIDPKNHILFAMAAGEWPHSALFHLIAVDGKIIKTLPLAGISDVTPPNPPPPPAPRCLQSNYF